MSQLVAPAILSRGQLLPSCTPPLLRPPPVSQKAFSKGKTMRKRTLQAVIYALGVVAFLSLTASGQINTATVTGVVTDATHALIPEAQVQITSEGMGVVKT